MKSARFALPALMLICCTACTRTTQNASVNEQSLDPTLILISIDGFRNDYLFKTATPYLRRLAEEGVRAEGMIPAFPSKTFPNHYTLVTGLYPSHHGIVGNTMFDPEFNARFKISDREAVQDDRWWGGEPIWVTAEKQGQISATYFWVGSEAKVAGRQPRYWKVYDGEVPDSARAAQALAWLDLPKAQRPTFIALYFSVIDDLGHDHGPDSPELAAALEKIDAVFGQLLVGLQQRNLFEKVNIIITSDHGMSATSSERLIYLADYIDLATIEIIDSTPTVTLRPKTTSVDEIYRALVQAHPHMKVYREREFPERFRYRGHRRIMPLMCLADDGWTISTRPRSGESKSWRGGAHGYDNLLPSMRAAFIAHGPAFQRGKVVPPFQNIHVYSLMAKLLNLQPAPNDGSLDSVRVLLR